MQVYHGERHMVRPRIVQKLVDGGVQLHDVCHHVSAGNVVLHTHFGFQTQACQRRAQIVRNACQHDGALLLQLGQLLGHTVKANVDFTNLAGDGSFIQLAGGKVAIAHAVGCVAELFERAVNQACNHRRARQ